MERIKNFLDSDTTEAKATKVALCIVAVGVGLGLFFFAAGIGNAVQIFKMFEKGKKYDKKQIREALNTLRKQKLIEYVTQKNGKTMVRITKKGETKLRAFDIELIKIKKQTKWDGKWRLVMYDIPIRFTKGRESLRYHLKELDFYQFQKSAWICPYPCEDEIIFIADFYGVGKYVNVLIVEDVPEDTKIKRYFNI